MAVLVVTLGVLETFNGEEVLGAVFPESGVCEPAKDAPDNVEI
jgi:hypothetical protein